MRNSSCSRLKTWELRDFNQANPVLQTREREKIKLMNIEQLLILQNRHNRIILSNRNIVLIQKRNIMKKIKYHKANPIIKSSIKSLSGLLNKRPIRLSLNKMTRAIMTRKVNMTSTKYLN